MITRNGLLRRVSLLSAMLLAGMAVGSSAQSTAAVQRWDAWMGCWRAQMPPTATGAAMSSPYVCVAPTSRTAAVELVTIDGSKILSRDTIDASGETQSSTVQGCQASKRGQFSADGRRVLLHSDVTCPDAKRSSTGMLAIAPTGEWLDIQSVTAGGNTGIRVTRYRDARPARTDSLPAEVRRQLDRSVAISAARTLAGGALDVRDVAEATRLVDTSVVQAWIVERGARFKLNASSIEALANSGVPGSVTDVMIGVSYPEHFALEQPRTMASGGYGGDLSSLDSARIAGRYIDDRCFSLYSSLYNSCGRGYGLYGYGLYGYNSYGGYYPGYSYGGYGFYNAPVIIVKGDQQPQQTHGRLVKGEGYTPGPGSSSSGGASRPSSGSSGSSSSGSSSGSSGSTSGSSSSGSSSSGSGRTAITRPPR